MSDVIYKYVKGKGWIPEPVRILNLSDYYTPTYPDIRNHSGVIGGLFIRVYDAAPLIGQMGIYTPIDAARNVILAWDEIQRYYHTAQDMDLIWECSRIDPRAYLVEVCGMTDYRTANPFIPRGAWHPRLPG